MHELAIVESIMETLLEQLEINNCSRILTVKLEFGAMTAVMPAAIDFAFEALSKGGPAEGAKIETTIIPIKAVCMDCGAESTLDDYVPFCPKCSDGVLQIIQGRDEMRIASIEIQ
ncbi:MAG: hydrogenase maturation nickel metallochaperone HypA [Desulfomonilaceae bacterium]